MTARFRITAYPVQHREEGLVYELFEAQTDAEKYYEELTAEDSPIRDCGWKAVTVTYEEFVYGDWVLANRQTLIIG